MLTYQQEGVGARESQKFFSLCLQSVLYQPLCHVWWATLNQPPHLDEMKTFASTSLNISAVSSSKISSSSQVE